MATVTMYDVKSPDGFSISFDTTWDTESEAKEALTEWIEGYQSQGYYSTSNGQIIPLDKLESRCSIVLLSAAASDVDDSIYSDEKKDKIESMVIGLCAEIGMGIPDNYETITQDVYEMICEKNDPNNWNRADVIMALRNWFIEHLK
jgi:hypothetical protein